MPHAEYRFRCARPVWKSGDETVMNQTLILEYLTPTCNIKLNIAGQSAYTVLVNGKLCAYGPARCAHGLHKVDEIELGGYLTGHNNIITIRVSGYNVNSYEFANSASFICAELIRDGVAVAYTDNELFGFRAYLYEERITKSPRFSVQRTFCECYDYSGSEEKREIKVSVTGNKHFIARDVPYGDYDRIYPTSVIAVGEVEYDDGAEYYNPLFVSGAFVNCEGYAASELDATPHVLASRAKCLNKKVVSESADIIRINSNRYADIEYPANQTGNPAFTIESDGEGELLMLFDECLSDGEVNCFRFKLIGAITFKLKAGSFSFVSAEPYVMKYVRFVALGANIVVKEPHIVEVAFPRSKIAAYYASDDSDMRRIYDAALESFRANTTDIYMDCPSRERAGWLCDSYFTSRVEYALTGRSDVERAFLLNFIDAKLETLPDGMLPMCYPSDHRSGRFIPNWAMWYLCELYEYYARSGDAELVEYAKPSMYELLKYFRGFENEYGLLESLESWVFVEWSKANDLVQDVSFASNMFYALFKDRMCDLYGDIRLKGEAEQLRATIRRMSMTPSGFFSDNAVRVNGKLVTTGERTETCQYYAFYTGVATKEAYPQLWRVMVDEFGPNREESGGYPEIYYANSLPGNYLRLDLLERAGLYDKLYSEIRGYFTYMADRTGTLWEHKSNTASMNHGFASHVICWMDKLGLLKRR